MAVTAPPAPTFDPALQAEIDRVRASDVLGPQGRLRELFDLLAVRSAAGEALKEAEIAMSVFGKGEAGATRDDPVARVYIHRLRKRLDDFYLRTGAPAGFRLDIPRGEYRIIARPLGETPAEAHGTPTPAADGSDPPPPARRRWSPVATFAAAFAAILVVGNISAWSLLGRPAPDPSAEARRSGVWTSLGTSERPLMVVVGDYYMFGEYEDRLFLKRLIRDFSINSKDDLVDHYLTAPREFERYADVALQYLPTSAAYAMADLMPLVADGRRVEVVLASELTPDKLKDNDIVFLGLFSGLGKLRDPVFSQSRFGFGESYDEIVDRQSGKRYVSEAFLAAPGDTMYRDYGYFASFSGPTGNRIAILSGSRDTALMGVAESLTRADFLAALDRFTGAAADFEALFEVKGQKQVNLETMLLAHAPIDSAGIWAGGQTTAVIFPAE